MNPRVNQKLDRWLDRALRQYGSAESRAGLEGRILANLAAEAKRAQVRSVWPWALAGAAAAALFVGIWFGVGYRGARPPEIVANRTISANVEHEQVPVIPPTMVEPRVSRRSSARRAHGAAAAELASEPRLDQFPSARPLSQEELLFASYAQRFPREALLMAQEHEQFEKEIQQAQQEAENGSAVSAQER